jgi:hypothetical protein
MSSSFHPRKETDCLNCGAEVKGRYCQDCGQPNREPVLKIGDLLGEFVHMFTHFDGKFFSTAKLLFTKPGFLSKAYLEGKRSRYLPPVQLYVFTSAIFFYLLYGFFLKTPEVLPQKDGVVQGPPKPVELELMSSGEDSIYLSRFENPEAYQRYQDSLPETKKDGFWDRFVNKRLIKINNDFKKDQEGTFKGYLDKFIHSFPKMLIVSLPLMALIMQIMYYKRKQLNFVSHSVFVIHLYVFSFLATILNMVLKSIGDLKGLGFVHWIAMAVLVWLFYYGYKAMQNFYGGRRWVTLLKYATILFLSGIATVVIFIGYTVLAFLFL